MTMLSMPGIRKRKRIKIVILDADGVLTDGSIIYDSRGGEYKIFSAQDGYGVQMLKKAGIKTAIVSCRTSPVTERRASELGIDDIYQGVDNKADALKDLEAKYNLKKEEVCAVGDDILDMPLLENAGLPVAVKNARPELKRIAVYVTKKEGGKGAVREVAEMLAGRSFT